jgi:hypothetical protein
MNSGDIELKGSSLIGDLLSSALATREVVDSRIARLGR